MSLATLGIQFDAIDGVYITHEHPDHAGGLAYLAYHSITRKGRKITLYADGQLMDNLWAQMAPHCRLFDGRACTLMSYFNLVAMDSLHPALWQTCKLSIHPWVHVPSEADQPMMSYGLTLRDLNDNVSVHITGDIAPSELNNLISFADTSDLMFVDCYTGSPYPGIQVHMQCQDYILLPDRVKAKLRLVHYNDNVLCSCEDGHPVIESTWQECMLASNLRFASTHDTFDTKEIRRVLNEQAAKEKRHGKQRASGKSTGTSNR